MADVKKLCEDALNDGDGILRLAPTWVPRSFLQPGRRLKLHPADYDALGMDRGGIDERWFSSTTSAANEGAPPDEGLSNVVHGDARFTFENTCTEPLVGLSYFGPDAQPDAPEVGAHSN